MRIKSKLKASVIAVTLLTIPVFSEAAGMGRLNVLSGLGQPFRAEIDLVAVQPTEAESLHAALASSDSFREAQIDYPPSSLGLRFDLEKRANGQYFISINSAQSVNEPFLDFLVELKWEGGRVLREYTALLDPVGYTPGKAAATPAVKPMATTPSVVAQPTPVSPPSKPSAPVEKSVAAKPATPAATPTPSSKQTSEGDTYTVKSGDSLAKIAKEHHVDGVSLEQMLVSLYQANQDAFEGNNMNRLKRGQILKLPGKDAASVDGHAAAQEIHAQAEDWRAYRAKLAESAGGSRASQNAEAGTGKIDTKVEDKASVQHAQPKDKLTLSKGDDTGKLKERVQSLEEDTAAKQKALADAAARVAELEQANKKLEQLLAMKSKQGADMQRQAEAAKAKAEQPTPTPVAQKTPEPKAVPTEAPKVEAAKVEPTKPVVADANNAAATTPVPTPAEAVQQPTPKPKIKHPKLPPPQPEPEPGLLDNPMVLGGGILGLGAILGGAFLWWRKRKKSSFEDSIITGSDLKSNTMVGNTGGAVISTGVTENSFLTDFSRAGLGTIDTDEVDPIAEAEVYMAYGRDAQAEEILKDALLRDNTRQEVRLKLLEIYSARKNAAAFESVAQDLYSATQGHGAVWTQAAAMGHALDPQNQLYQLQEPVNTGSLDQTMVLSAGTLGDLSDTAQLRQPLVNSDGSMAAGALVDGDDLDFQLDAAASHAPAGEAMPAGELDFDLGFDAPSPSAPNSAGGAHMAEADLDIGALEMPLDAPKDGERLEPTMDAAHMDFDLGEFSLDAPAPAGVAAPVVDDAGIMSLDIPLDMGGEPAHAPIVVAAPSVDAALDHGFDLDIGTHDEIAVEAPPATMAAHADAAMDELETPDIAGGLDFDFELNEPTTAPPAGAAMLDMGDISLDLDVAPAGANGSDVMDFGVELDDPVTTKIDLARAYIDMGDKEGAREILQEAATEGNPEQKASAESLLAQL